MSNDSTEPGYLTPVGAEPDYDQELERQISRWIRGITGLDASVVLPRWTDPQQQIHKSGITWCEFGIAISDPEDFPADVQVDEQSQQWVWEKVNIICCFYGPQGNAMASRFRAGMFVEQNNTALRSASGLSFLDAGKIFNLPVLINNQWVRRYDLTVTLSRKNIRTFNIKTIQSAPVQFFGD
ncbi:hypothetical protein AAIG33_24920 [Phytobacter ursingii]|uniref:phage neck terminator protein n=1 Tax=Phytobacter ursingii TaxID=1972431 RepID=UPI0031B7DEE7